MYKGYIRGPFCKDSYLEVHGTYEPSIGALISVFITLVEPIGALKGLMSGLSVQLYNWLISTMNLQLKPNSSI